MKVYKLKPIKCKKGKYNYGRKEKKLINTPNGKLVMYELKCVYCGACLGND